MTVSRVVAGVSTVSASMRDSVNRAIEQLGYEPNRTAAAMRNSSNGGWAVGLCVETIENPFSAAVARGLELALRPHGCLLFTASSEGEAVTERDVLLEFYRRRVAGLVVMTVCTDHNFLVPRVHPQIPIVYLDRPALLQGCDAITSDHREGGDQCTSHLIGYGHRSIAFVGSNVDGHPICERLNGYRAALERADIPYASELVVSLRHDRSMDDARNAVKQLLAGPVRPTAIFAASNADMLAVTQTLHHLGLENQIAHIGFDDIAAANVVNPPLSAYLQDPVALGQRCGAALLRRRGATSPLPSLSTVLPGQLLARGSGEIAASTRLHPTDRSIVR